MKREKVLRVLLPLLIVIALAVWARGLGGLRKKGPSDVPLGAGAGGSNKGLFLSDVLTRVRPESSYPQWGRNPFEISAERSPKSILSGILWERDSPQAMINGEIVGIGGKTGPYTVVDIRQDRVILNDGTEDLEVLLGGAQE